MYVEKRTRQRLGQREMPVPQSTLVLSFDVCVSCRFRTKSIREKRRSLDGQQRQRHCGRHHYHDSLGGDLCRW